MSHPTRFKFSLRPAAVLLLSALAVNANAAEFIVNTAADAPDQVPGDGQCAAFGLPPAARCTLRAAIMEANAQGGSHLIGLPLDYYELDEVGADEDQAVTGDLDIRADIRIVNGTADFPAIDQETQDRVFEVHPTASLVLDHVAVLGGRVLTGAAPFGGGIRVWYEADLELNRSFLFGNGASKGGGIHSWGNVTMVDSDLQYNFLVDPAPDDQNQGSAIAIERTIFGPAQLTMTRSSLNLNGEVEIDGDLVTNAYALLVEGGATASLTNASLIQNSRGAWVRGGSTLFMGLSTIAANKGFGLRFDHNPGNPNPQLQIGQSVIAGNEGVAECRAAGALFINPNLTQIQVSNLFNAAIDPSCGFTGENDQALNGWPFHPQVMGAGVVRYYQPAPGRGLIDTAGPNCLATDDVRSGARPINGSGLPGARCDIGSVEFDPDNDPALPDQLFSGGFED